MLYFNLVFLDVVYVNNVNFFLFGGLKLHLFLLLQLLYDLELLLLFLVYFPVDFPEFFAETGCAPIQVVVVVQVHLVFAMLLVRVQIGVKVAGDGLRNLLVVMELGLLLDTVLIDHARVAFEVVAQLVHVQLLREGVLII